MFLRLGNWRLQVFILYSMHKTFEQLMITRCFALISWLFRIRLVVACLMHVGVVLWVSFSISLCWQIIAKWLYFLSVTLGLFFSIMQVICVKWFELWNEQSNVHIEWCYIFVKAIKGRGKSLWYRSLINWDVTYCTCLMNAFGKTVALVQCLPYSSLIRITFFFSSGVSWLRILGLDPKRGWGGGVRGIL